LSGESAAHFDLSGIFADGRCDGGDSCIGDLLQLYVSQMIGGFWRGLVFPLLMSFSVATMAPGAKATAMGVFQSLYALGMFAGPVVVGVMADTAGLGAGFWLCGLARSWDWFDRLALCRGGELEEVQGGLFTDGFGRVEHTDFGGGAAAPFVRRRQGHGGPAGQTGAAAA
jgi:MFS family permease